MNLQLNGITRNPTVAELKTTFAHVGIDWEKPIKISIHERYIKHKDGFMDILKKAIEPTYNRNIDGQPTQVRYYKLQVTKNSGGAQIQTYTPSEVDFGKFGCFDFDFSNDFTTSDTSLFWFLMNHPLRGQEFDIVLPEKAAADWEEKERNELKVRNMFLTKSSNYITDEKLVVLAAQMKVTNPESIGEKQLRKLLYDMAMADAGKFISVYGSRTFETVGLVRTALELKVLYFNSGTLNWHYTYAIDPNDILKLKADTNTVLYRVRPHMQQKPEDDLAWWLAEADGNGNLGLIQEGVKTRKYDLANHPQNKIGDKPEQIKKFAARINVEP